MASRKESSSRSSETTQVTTKEDGYVQYQLADCRTFVVGDIHGCVDELSSLVRFFEEDQGLTQGDALIFVGDYIDRGPASKEVIDFLIEFEQRTPSDLFFLKGNHEEMFLDWLEGTQSESGISYLHNGGRECLESYGLSVDVAPEDASAQLPHDHLAFLKNLERYIVSEKYVFVHAGLNPLRPLSHQFDEDIFWIRGAFIENIHSFQRTVIFGHTPFDEVKFHLPYKIGIDTGLVYGNALTALEVASGAICQISRDSSEVRVTSAAERGVAWPKTG
ncbi:MAG: metallophosphoesterase family protein [Bdellovibrionota bacterium]|jgi:serine/threonine protein phosphatase 1